ncbi:hypothetical protein ACPCDX_28845 [Streptomyces koyangensis]
MNVRTRTARHTLRQPASTHLIAAGIHPTLARRYSGLGEHRYSGWR